MVSPEMPKTRRGKKPEGGRKRHGSPLIVQPKLLSRLLVPRLGEGPDVLRDPGGVLVTRATAAVQFRVWFSHFSGKPLIPFTLHDQKR